MTVIDLFAGCGGWDLGARSLGLEPLGIELEPRACATRRAADLLTVRANLAHYPIPRGLHVEGLIASPPCQSFSRAGNRQGVNDARGELVWAPLAWAEALRPRWCAWEQVPEVESIWWRCANRLQDLGYSVCVDVLSAEQWGVPQTRSRAFLLASLDRKAVMPKPTHQKFETGKAQWPGPQVDLDLFGTGELMYPWVSMAQALGLDDGLVGFPRRADDGEAVVLDKVAYRSRDFRELDQPAFTLTVKARSWMLHTRRDQVDGEYQQVLSTDRPAPAVTSKTGGQWQLKGGNQDHAAVRSIDEPAPTIPAHVGKNAGGWQFRRPATTVGCDPKVSPPIHHEHGMQGRGAVPVEDCERDDQPIRLTIEQGLALQSFPVDFPVQGPRTAKWRQVGNAVPPLLARAVLAAITGAD